MVQLLKIENNGMYHMVFTTKNREQWNVPYGFTTKNREQWDVAYVFLAIIREQWRGPCAFSLVVLECCRWCML